MLRSVPTIPGAIARVVLLALPAMVTAAAALGATPPAGTLSDTNKTVAYAAGPFLVSNPTGAAGAPTCSAPGMCDDFLLTVSLPADYATTHPTDVVTVKVQWPTAANDFDVYVRDAAGNTVKTAASSSDPEVAILPAGSGTYQLVVRVVPFTVAAESFTGTITLSTPPPAPPAGSGIAPRYQNYAATGGLGTSAGEPSIGANWQSGNAMFQAGLETLRVGFDDTTSPARAAWTATESQITSTTSLDPILFTDHKTNRTFASQLTGVCSLMAFSDDDGASWTPSEGCGTPAGVDHQTVGGGSYGPVGVPLTSYPDNVYYASQEAATALAARSDTGGLSFGGGIPMWNLTQCGGLHGHVKVAPDGTVYVPNKGCGGSQGVAVSENDGITWAIRPVPGSAPGDTDPSVGIASDGTVYFGYQNGDGHPRVAVSRDKGQTWTDDQDAGVTLGIQNSVFPAVVAGDPARAAFTFIGTPTAGNYQDTLNFKGIWHLYVAHTFDGGRSWILVDATPTDPVQAGSICTGGTTCGEDRNLLDFIDVTVDKQGRTLVGYADGCTDACAATPASSLSRGALATIARQSGGRRLYAAYDPAEPTRPAAPLLGATRDASGVHLAWSAPDSGGSAISSYKVYRGTASGAETFLANAGTKTSYSDATSTTYFYRVSAVNTVGEGGQSNEVSPAAGPPPAVEDPCTAPGATVATDPAGDQTGAPASAALDIQRISVAEPYLSGGSSALVFTIKVANLNPAPPNATWKALFTAPNGTTYFVAMSTFDPTAVKFTYGHIAVDPTTGVQQNVTDGSAGAGSAFTADGRILIVIADAKVGGLLAGDTIGNVSGRTQALVGTFATGGLLVQTDAATGSSYTLAGNASCRPNAAPTAAILATPSSGFAPLAVTLDGSASSDPDAGDTIASYSFDFGDGSTGVTQAEPTVSHSYAAGTYTATLSVTDSRGKASASAASATITVTNPPAGSSSVSGGGFLDQNGRINFNFNVASNLAGSLKYIDNASNTRFQTTSLDGYSTSGPCATFTGNAYLQGGGDVRYKVIACDNGDPGRDRDTFSIQITGATVSARSGAIAAGNIKLKKN